MVSFIWATLELTIIHYTKTSWKTREGDTTFFLPQKGSWENVGRFSFSVIPDPYVLNRQQQKSNLQGSLNATQCKLCARKRV